MSMKQQILERPYYGYAQAALDAVTERFPQGLADHAFMRIHQPRSGCAIDTASCQLNCNITTNSV